LAFLKQGNHPVEFLALLLWIAATDGGFDAAVGAAFQYKSLAPLQGRSGSVGLRVNIDAAAILPDHASDTAHPTFQSGKPVADAVFVLLHGRLLGTQLPVRGYSS